MSRRRWDEEKLAPRTARRGGLIKPQARLSNGWLEQECLICSDSTLQVRKMRLGVSKYHLQMLAMNKERNKNSPVSSLFSDYILLTLPGGRGLLKHLFANKTMMIINFRVKKIFMYNIDKNRRLSTLMFISQNILEI